MAKRKNTTHAQKTREKIQSSQLINRLINHALSDEDIMSPSQVNAAKILIAKTLPDLKAVEVEHKGAISADVQVNVNPKSAGD